MPPHHTAEGGDQYYFKAAMLRGPGLTNPMGRALGMFAARRHRARGCSILGQEHGTATRALPYPGG